MALLLHCLKKLINTMSNTRIEKDSLGEIHVLTDALYAAQTQRAIDNFPISHLPMPAGFIRALALVKQCCAQANLDLKMIDPAIAGTIVELAEEIVQGQHLEQFPIDVFQTGSGTSSNMNMNEVITGLAKKKGQDIHPNNHVNMSQSSNDTIPTTIHVSACIEIEKKLKPALKHLETTLQSRSQECQKHVKTGRTHLMDAMPVTLGQELGAWQQQICYGIDRLDAAMVRLLELAQGGTAVGTGINCPTEFPELFCQHLKNTTNLQFSSKPNKFEGLSAQDAAVEMSGVLRTIAVSMMKISNDLRWMNSGPLAGYSEISLTALQPGSSIMPGKTNPVIPEAVAMVCAQVMGNDTTISIAGQSGNFQLNVMLPVIAYNLLQSIELLANSARLLADKAIASFTVNEDKITQALEYNPILVTALNRTIGYEKGAMIAKKSYREKRPIAEVVAEECPELSIEKIRTLLNPMDLTTNDKK